MTDDWTPRELRLMAQTIRRLVDDGRLNAPVVLEREAAEAETLAALTTIRDDHLGVDMGVKTATQVAYRGEREGPESVAADILYVYNGAGEPGHALPFTLAQVRELSAWVNRNYPNVNLGSQPFCLPPFLPLLSEAK